MFDKIFKPNATQDKIYNEAAKTIVKGKTNYFISPSSFCPSFVNTELFLLFSIFNENVYCDKCKVFTSSLLKISYLILFSFLNTTNVLYNVMISKYKF